MADDLDDDKMEARARAADALGVKVRDLEIGANGFARAMTRAFASAATSGRQFDDILKSLALRLSDLAVRAAFRPLERSIANGFQNLFSGLFGGGSSAPAEGTRAALGAITPFAAGGVISAPTYFPLTNGGAGLAGEAGPEAIMPLKRSADGRLGVASDGAAASVIVNIATPDIESFRRSESHVVGQIARAVARGRRSL
jgi:phage-related minor tail protein